MADRQQQKRVKRQRLPLSKQIKLCNLVQEKRLLWMRNHPKYKKNDCRIAAWNEIGEILQLTGSDCKAYWESFKERHRYLTGKKALRLSGNTSEDPDSQHQFHSSGEALCQEWELWDAYKFVCQEGTKIITSSSSATSKIEEHSDNYDSNDTLVEYVDCVLGSETTVRTENSDKQTSTQSPMFQSPCTHDHDYKQPKQGCDSTSSIAQTLDSLENYLKMKCNAVKSSQSQQTVTEPSPNNDYLYFGFEFLRSQLQKLPFIKVQELLQIFMNETFKAVQEQELSNTTAVKENQSKQVTK